MYCIICNEESRPFFRALLSRVHEVNGQQDVNLICDGDQLEKFFSSPRAHACTVVIEVALNWGGTYLQDFFGFDVAVSLRRHYLVKSPIVFFSAIPKSYLDNLGIHQPKFMLLNATGSVFISFPPSLKDFSKRIPEAKTLDDNTLHNIVLEFCGVRKEWQAISHKIANVLSSNFKRHPQVVEALDEWAESIRQFAPEQLESLRRFKSLLYLPADAVNTNDLRMALENLDDGLQGGHAVTDTVQIPTLSTRLPKYPPKGFSKVLIADDEPQPFLVNSLRNQFGYQVIGQAFNLSQAKEYLDKYKPDVVLSDYYFKKTSRETEIPDKEIGDKFIHYVLTRPYYLGRIPQKPIILVTSKATLRSEADIRVGAINCSGANRATDPSYIHSVIWTEARKRSGLGHENIIEPELPIEYISRHRLELYLEDLLRLIKQWKAFKSTVQETLTLCRLLSQSPENDHPEIVRQAIESLEPYEKVQNFSLGIVLKLFAEIDVIHQSARAGPISQAKNALRNILHGKIEQFSQVTNAAKFLITTLDDVAGDLLSRTPYEHLGRRLKQELDQYAEIEPLLPFLTVLSDDVQQILLELPASPIHPDAPRTSGKPSGVNSSTILVVEDNDFWRDVVVGAVEKVKARLGEDFAISYQCFDNAADIIATIPSTDKSFAIAGSNAGASKTVVVVDICLPKDRDHAARIRAAQGGALERLEMPSTEHGIKLVQTLSDYGDNVPIIIFSTIDSIEDRESIGYRGVADEDFLVKGMDDEEAVVRALIRKIEKKSKYVVEKVGDEGGVNRFRINGIPIPLTSELERTFSAIYTLYQRNGSREFTVADIIITRGDSNSDISRKTVQDHIYRIRTRIHETLINNRIYVDVRNLIRTIKPADSEDFSYQPNAEVTSIKDEAGYEADLDSYTSETCRVLVVDGDLQTTKTVTRLLEGLGYEVERAINIEDAARAAKEFLPHIVSVDLRLPHERAGMTYINDSESGFGGLEAWDHIRTSLNSSTLGVVIPTAYTDKSELVAKAAKMGIPLRNFISKRDAKWLNHYLTTVFYERRRVFLGEIMDARQDMYEPIVKILVGSDLSRGVLKLTVDERPLKIKVSQKSQIIGLLLKKPKELLSFEFLKSCIGGEGPVSENDIKNWPKRIKDIIEEKWLVDHPVEYRRQLAEYILESSSRGMKLNAHVVDLRT